MYYIGKLNVNQVKDLDCILLNNINSKRDTIDDVNKNKELIKYLEEDPMRFEKGKENRNIFLKDPDAIPTYLEEEEIDIYSKRQEMKKELPQVEPVLFFFYIIVNSYW